MTATMKGPQELNNTNENIISNDNAEKMMDELNDNQEENGKHLEFNNYSKLFIGLLTMINCFMGFAMNILCVCLITSYQ